MNRIETGTTGERWIRCALFIAMCVVFGGWFGYDGWVSYPSKNLETFKQDLPAGAPTDSITINDRVTGARVGPIHAALQRNEAVPRSQLVSILGDPAFDDPKTGYLYFIGPALLVEAKPIGDQLRLASDLVLKPSKEHTEKDIQGQKSTTFILIVVVVVAVIQLIRVLTTRVIVDDEGLNYNGKAIAWDAMTGLDASRYREKGWVDLEYKSGDATDTLRIDNYKVKAFKEVVAALCERKGFPSPLVETDDTESDSDGETRAEA